MRQGRTNITLDADVADMLREIIDRIELDRGFRPTSAQVVRGLIAKEHRDSRLKPLVETEGLDAKHESGGADRQSPKSHRPSGEKAS